MTSTQRRLSYAKIRTKLTTSLSLRLVMNVQFDSEHSDCSVMRDCAALCNDVIITEDFNGSTKPRNALLIKMRITD